MIMVKTGVRHIAANILSLAAFLALGLEAIRAYRIGMGHPSLLLLMAVLLSAASYFIDPQVRERIIRWSVLILVVCTAWAVLYTMLR
jgi:uncharacterized membrane protein YedE/YeeE